MADCGEIGPADPLEPLDTRTASQSGELSTNPDTCRENRMYQQRVHRIISLEWPCAWHKQTAKLVFCKKFESVYLVQDATWITDHC